MAIHRSEGDPSAVPIAVHGSVQLLPFVTALTTSGFDIRFDRDTGSLLIREASGEPRRATPALRKAPVRVVGKRGASKKRRTRAERAAG
jgi:hypothetical protein